ncbi:MAG TPA: hypothetical protein VFP10_12390 [Candidatus Eisenbacteria bacterium]|nr:hypothetical protein [Candidatus Eisenbacteria bacterium]
MAVVTTNLIQGPATLYVDDFGATEPADTAVASPPGGTFTDVGGTQDGVTLRVATEWAELEVDQIAETPERRRTKVESVISTNLAEPTLDNLSRALNVDPDGATTGVGFEAIDVPGGSTALDSPYYQAILLDGRAPNAKRRRVIARKCLNTADVESAYAKGDQTLIPVEFTAHYVSSSIGSVHIVDGT